MSLKFRSFWLTCAFLVGGFAAALTFQLSREPRSWDELRTWQPTTERSSAQVSAIAGAAAGSTKAIAAGTQSARALVDENMQANIRDSAAGASVVAVPVTGDEVPPVVVSNDPVTRIRRLSDVASGANSRLERLVALSTLGSLAGDGDESGEITTALLYAMGNSDPVVAARAKALYSSVQR